MLKRIKPFAALLNFVHWDSLVLDLPGNGSVLSVGVYCTTFDRSFQPDSSKFNSNTV